MKQIPVQFGHFTSVDNSDFEELSKFRWYRHRAGYVVRYENMIESQRNIRMHRQIMGFPNGLDVDHINHNKLDNQRSNLRVCTRIENSRNQKLKACNTSGYKGVHKQKSKWQAAIRFNGRTTYIGIFETKIEAAIAYDEASVKHFGKFACTNKMLGLL